jgi:hypothetical protein
MICVKRVKIEEENEVELSGEEEELLRAREDGEVRARIIKENSLRENSPQKMQSKSNRK